MIIRTKFSFFRSSAQESAESPVKGQEIKPEDQVDIKVGQEVRKGGQEVRKGGQERRTGGQERRTVGQ